MRRPRQARCTGPESRHLCNLDERCRLSPAFRQGRPGDSCNGRSYNPLEDRYDFSPLRDQLEQIARLGRVTTVQLNASRQPAFLSAKVPLNKVMLIKEQDSRGTIQSAPGLREGLHRYDRWFAREINLRLTGPRLLECA